MAAVSRRGAHVGRLPKLTLCQVAEAKELIGAGQKDRADLSAVFGVDVDRLRRHCPADKLLCESSRVSIGCSPANNTKSH
jgi:hypothetical protein